MFKRFSIIFLLIALPAGAARDSVSLFFVEGDYQGAREALDLGPEGLRAGEATLWAAQLAESPDKALVLLREGLDDSRLPDAVRIRLAKEIADIEFGLGRYQSCLKSLAPVLGDPQADLPGSIHLRAGLALRALGSLQKAREMLASVKPQDPAFMLARYYLGDIALEQNDSSLALRYFDSAANNSSGAGPRIAGGQWRAYQAENREAEANQLELELSRSAPGCLSLLEIQRLRREREEELEAMVPAPESTPEASGNQPDRGRYALQLGAFSDRGLALDFLRRYRDQISDLHIDEVRDQRGQFLYKVRTGSFVNPALAKTEAKRLARQFDMEVIVADLSNSGSRSD